MKSAVMGTSSPWFGYLLSLAVWLLMKPAPAQAPFIYVNNETRPNTVSAFRMDSEGKLSSIPGSPFPTGGDGGRASVFRVFSNATIWSTKDLLFVCNTASDTISVFDIHADGSLTLVEGSPFETGGRLPVALATNPQGTLLFVSHFISGDLGVFSIASDGRLLPLPGSPFDVRPLREPAALMVNSTGELLFIVGENAVSVYRIEPEGAVTPLAESPTEWPLQTSVITPEDRFLYATGPEADGIVGFRLSAQGDLTPLVGSPFPGSSSGALHGLAIAPNGKFLLGTAPGEAGVYLYRIGFNGSLQRDPRSPFPTAGETLRPIAIDPNGTFALAADVREHALHVLRLARRRLVEIEASPFDLGNDRARPSGIAVR